MTGSGLRAIRAAYPLLLLAVVAAVCGNTLLNGFVWDDNVNLVGKSVYRDFRLYDIFFTLHNGIEYFPLRDFSFALDHQLWGERPAGFHLTNLIFYALDAIAVYLLAREVNVLLGVTEQRDDAASRDLAFLAALLFALHPVHCEVVNAVFNRGALMAGLFFFGAAGLFLRFIRSGSTLHRHLAGALLLFLLTLLSKQYGIILPLLLLMFVGLAPGGTRRKAIAWTVPFFVLSLLFFLLYKTTAENVHVIVEGSRGGYASAIAGKAAVAIQIPFFYLGKMFLPHGFPAEYDTRFSGALFKPLTMLAVLALSGLLAWAVSLRRRYPEFLFGVGWFLLSLIPVMNFFATNPVVADRYVFLPSFGISYPVAVLMIRLVAGRWRKVALVAVCGVLLALAGAAFAQNRVWRDGKSLWTEAIVRSPRLVKAYENLGVEYLKERDFSRAESYFARMRGIDLDGSAKYAYYRGRIFQMQGDYPGAAEAYRAALAQNSDYLMALFALGALSEETGAPETAIDCYHRTISSREQDHYGKKAVAREREEKLQADFAPLLARLRQRAAQDPLNLKSLEELALTLDKLCLYEEALAAYLKMTTLKGSGWPAYFNAGNVCKKLRRYPEAARYYETCLGMNPGFASGFNNLGSVYRETKQYDRAVAAFTRAMELDRGLAPAPYNLACVYYDMGDRENARRYFRYVRERFPELESRVNAYLQLLTEN